MRWIDAFLNRVTMYWLMVWGLRALLAVALVLAFSGQLHFTWVALAATGFTICLTTLITDWLLAHLFRVARNTQTWLITGLILTFLVQPTIQPVHLALVALAG